jgi:hypothetical protein
MTWKLSGKGTLGEVSNTLRDVLAPARGWGEYQASGF